MLCNKSESGWPTGGKKKKGNTGTALGFTDDMTLHLQLQGGSGTDSAGA